ncbi:MAG: hypothetical protein ONB44_19780 [candidate division KSB1 bacterium]|nr:hypothetical protein [candidate division KSB1 bacterium]MDZ7304370.1 hypothetical protein [candidate division KSB1 bacterium]
MKSSTKSCLIAIAIFAMAATAFAQEKDKRVNSLERGNRSLAFSLFSDGGTFGYWVLKTRRTNLGINLGLRVSHTDDGRSRTSWNVQLAPAIKRYMIVYKSVAPHYYGCLQAGYGKDSNTTNWNFGLNAGFGVEWFPVPEISVGSFTGFNLSYSQQTAGDDTRKSFNVLSFTPRLTMYIYF